MNDYEYAFKEDAKEKKAAGRVAFARKGGSKSKRCSLPSDNLTPAQKRALNGEVKTYDLNKPMAWDFFKMMPKDLQEEYIRKIVATFAVSLKGIDQELFGGSGVRFQQFVLRNGLNVPRSRGKKDREVYLAQFRRWINGEISFCTDTVAPEPEIPAGSICVGEIAVPKTEARFPVKSLEMHMEGSASDLIQALTMFLCGRDAELEISIKFKEES